MSGNDAIAARIRALYGKRLQAVDYAALMACGSVSEVAETLAQFPAYTAVASVLTAGNLHRGYLESVLRRQYFDEFLRLYSYLSQNDRRMAAVIITRYEITELLYCLQESRKETGFINFKNSYIDRYSVLDFDALSCAANHTALLEALEGTPYGELLRPLLENGVIRYLDAENVLDGYYYKRAVQLCQQVLPKGQQKELRRMLGLQIDFANLSRIIRLKKYFDFTPPEIVPYLLTPYYRLNEEILNRVMEEPEEAAWPRILEGTDYAALFGGTPHAGLSENMDEMLIGTARKMIHFSSSPPALVLAYLKTKELELKNVVTLIESKRYGLSDSETRPHLIGLGA